MKPILFAVLGSVLGAASFAAEPTPPAGPAVLIEVKELATDKPVAGLKLGSCFNGAMPIVPGVTDAAGQFRLPLPADEVRGLLVETVAMDGYAQMQWYWAKSRSRDPLPDRIVIGIEKAVEFGGKVLDDAGAPVAGATVRIRATRRYNDRQQAKLQQLTVTSQADGQWTCRALPPGAEAIMLTVGHPRYVTEPGDERGRRYDSLAALGTEPVILRLQRGAPLEGVVRDLAGAPVAGARVRVGDRRPVTQDAGEVKTDKLGRFACGVRPGEKVTLTIRAKGFAPELKQFVAPEKPQPLVVDLQPGHLLTGRLRDEQGQPVTNAFIHVVTWRELPVLNMTLRPDAAGQFEWKDAPADPVIVNIYRPPGGTQKATLQAGETNDITLLSATIVSGTVVDDDTGAPVSDFRVSLGTSTDATGRIGQWMSRTGPNDRAGAGKFSTLFSPDPHHHVIRIEADGFPPLESPVFKLDGKPRTFAFRLAKGEWTRGTVRGPAAQPLANVDVILITRTSEIQTENGRVPAFLLRGAVHTTTGAEGMFRLPKPEDAFGLLLLHDAGFAHVAGADLRDNPEVTLTAWAVVQGTLAKAANQPVVLRHRSPSDTDRLPAKCAAYFSAMTDAAGKFQFERVLPGEMTIAQEGSAVALTNVTVKAGQTLELRLGR